MTDPQAKKKPGPARQFAPARKVWLAPHNEAFVRREAAASGASVSEIIRRALDHAETCSFFEKRADA